MSAAAFTARGALTGACRSIPLALGVAAYGAVFGALARRTGLSLAESALMSGLVTEPSSSSPTRAGGSRRASTRGGSAVRGSTRRSCRAAA